MSLQNLAQHLAAQGRGNDKMLMHVTPREVDALQHIAMSAGGSLTVNPNTGLPEAGFFDFIGDLLPQIAGVGVGALTNPLIGAAVAGVGQTAKTGNLMSGIMAGLGAYGGTNLLQGLSNAGANVASQAANAATQAGQAGGVGLTLPTGAADAASGFTGAGSLGLKAAPEALASELATSAPGAGSMFSVSPSAVGSGIGGASKATDLFTMSNPAEISGGNLLGGIKSLGSSEGRAALGTAMGKAGAPLTGMQTAAKIATPVVSASLNLTPSKPVDMGGGRSSGSFSPISALRSAYSTPQPTGGKGGDFPVPFNAGGYTGYNESGYTPDTSEIAPNFDFRTGGPMNEVTDDYAKGGYLNGPGDGMSDDIPATIEGKQPARLADGEFVVPADVVSHLGNGSTKAGAQRLYEMMSKVRKARTGNPKQGKQINPNRFIPA